MTGPVHYRRQEQRFTPPKTVDRDYLDLVGHVVHHADGSVTVTPRSRQMELVLEGMRTFWDRKYGKDQAA